MISIINSSPKFTKFSIIFCSASLLAIWALPGTIALRHFLLIAGCIFSFFYLKKNLNALFSKRAWLFWLLFGFFGWLLIHLAVFSIQVDLQAHEFLSLWIRSLLGMVLGLALGLCLSENVGLRQTEKFSKSFDWPLIILFVGLSGTSLISLGWYLYISTLRQQWINYEFDILYNFYRFKPPFVVATALFTPLCYILIDKAINKEICKWWIIFCLTGVILSLLMCVFSNTKNGIIIFGFSSLFFIVTIILHIHFNWSRMVLIGILSVLIGSVSFFGIKMHIERNTAWPNLIADIKVATDIEQHKRWRNRALYSLPENEFGTPVNESTYERIAWFTAGAHLLTENPQGFGLIHHSFGWLALAKWSDFHKPNGNSRGATHSGWMDMALGVGIPGILLIWIPLFAAWYRSWFQKGIWFSYVSWTIPIVVFTYLTTELAGQHFTELLFFMVAFFCGVTLKFPAPKRFYLVSKLSLTNKESI